MNHDDTVVVRVSREQMPPDVFKKFLRATTRSVKKAFPRNKVLVVPDNVTIEIK